jgi:hypothetical protein
MNSAKYINYELRPAKFVERKMFTSVLLNIIGTESINYQYVGLGGLLFTDFKLFHKELGISKMTSIEGGKKIDIKRIKFNKPFSFIQLEKGLSTDLLGDDEKVNLNSKTIIWMDYDNDLENFMFEDISHIFRKIPTKSVYFFTCNTTLKNYSGEVYSLTELKEKYGKYVPYDISQKDLTEKNSQNLIKSMLNKHINETLKTRNNIDDSNLKAHPLFQMKYSESSGAPMMTYAVILENKDVNINEKYGLKKFDFVVKKNEDNFFEIDLPNVSNIERNLINVTEIDKQKKVTSKCALDPTEIDKYRKLYKYLPTYFDVRQ